jgi:hypothetical protein
MKIERRGRCMGLAEDCVQLYISGVNLRMYYTRFSLNLVHQGN